MLTTVICVLYKGGVYDPSWVNRLYRGFERNANGTPFRFLCLTDDVSQVFYRGVEVAQLDDPSEGWMALNETFRSDIGIDRGLLVGLDTIIVGDVSHILNWRGEFGVIRNPMGDSSACCNAILSFDRPWADKLWSTWDADRPMWRRACSVGLGPDQNGRPSEVIFLRLNADRSWTFLDDLWPKHVISYKVHLTADPSLLTKARIVYFHGTPKPNDIAALSEHWV